MMEFLRPDALRLWVLAPRQKRGEQNRALHTYTTKTFPSIFSDQRLIPTNIHLIAGDFPNVTKEDGAGAQTARQQGPRRTG